MQNTSLKEPDKNTNANAQDVDLRDPHIAGVLAWILPGAGHFYQRRYFKAAVFGVSIWALLIAGVVMGSYRVETESGESLLYVGRNVYCSWRPGDRRLAFIPQAFNGSVAIPAFLQARRRPDGNGSVFSRAFAPPRIPSETMKNERMSQPDADEIASRLNSWLDVGLLYTMTAGLLNLFAIFDAMCGPAPPDREEEDEKEEKKKKKGAAPKPAAA